jgi:hypothetical protein
MVDTPKTPVLATVPRVELASVGWWDISNATDWHPTAQDLAAAVAALDCPAVRRPVLKFGHTGESGEGDPTIGLVDGLSVSDDGQTLLGDFVGVPAWLAAADAQGRSVIASAYPDRSGEFQHDYVCQLGHTHPFVVHAVALLGVVRPGIGTLQSLYDLYTVAPELTPEKEALMAKAAAGAGITVDQVRKAYYAGPGTDWMLWIREMFVDPPELIVQNDADDSLLRVPYTVTGEDIEFSDGQAVQIQYVNARSAAGKPVVAFASAAESRPTRSASAENTTNPGEEGAMPTLIEDLRARLGLPADADDAAITAALQTALPASVTPAPTAPAQQDAPTPAPVAAPVAASATERTATERTVTIDAGAFEALRRDAADGAAARQEQLTSRREQLVAAAVGDGRIAPASRGKWLKAISASVGAEDAEAELGRLEKGTIPLAAIGHEGGLEETTDGGVEQDARYKNWSF